MSFFSFIIFVSKKIFFFLKIQDILLGFFSRKVELKRLPIQGAKNIGLCSVVLDKYVDMFLISAHSFYSTTGLNLPIYLVDDGTITPKNRKKLC